VTPSYLSENLGQFGRQPPFCIKKGLNEQGSQSAALPADWSWQGCASGMPRSRRFDQDGFKSAGVSLAVGVC